MFANVQMTGEWYHSSLITDSTSIVKDMSGAPLPCTVTLFVTSGDTMTFEQSFDGGSTWVLEDTITITKSYILTSGCSSIRITRSAGTSLTSYFTVC